MTDREKLKKLVRGCIGNHGFVTPPELVDYLIANGVTVKKSQKPLTVEELPGRAKDIVYVERLYNGLNPLPMFLRDVERELLILQEFGRNGQLHVGLKEYGYSYRFWAEKPTDEERKAAEWDDK